MACVNRECSPSVDLQVTFATVMSGVCCHDAVVTHVTLVTMSILIFISVILPTLEFDLIQIT